MNIGRHRRIISSDSLKPSHKPLPAVTTPRAEHQHKLDFFKQHRKTMHTQGIRGLDQMTYSYSFDENQPSIYQYEKELFSRFLNSKHLEWMSIISSMAEQHPSEMVSFVRIGENTQEIYDNRMMAHYIGIWLMSMGYLQKQTKERIVENVELMFGDNTGSNEIAEIMYDSLLQGHLPADLQMKALLQVCKRGWQYFTFLICRLIRLLKKLNGTKNLYKQIEKAIDNK